jgi:hypothetical protein
MLPQIMLQRADALQLTLRRSGSLPDTQKLPQTEALTLTG